jgi:glucosyl-dolichyl phosphate glucuronosyltransferase
MLLDWTSERCCWLSVLRGTTLKYTIAICTWNRADLLSASILSVAQQLAPPSYEILVVDNASVDATRQVVSQLMTTVDALRLTVEHRLGLNFARNRALTEADTDIVVFLDDDARADPTWLDGIDRAFREHPRAACIGGPIRLEWPTPRPSWFPSHALPFLGELNLSDESRKLSNDERLFGANMAVRREAAMAVGAFHTELGRRGRSLHSGGEIEFFTRLQRGGNEIWWEPAASVTHLVDPNRVSMSWLSRRAWMQGRSDTLLAHWNRQARPPLARPPLRATFREQARHARRAIDLVMDRNAWWSNIVVLSSQMAGRLYGRAALAVSRGRAVR